MEQKDKEEQARSIELSQLCSPSVRKLSALSKYDRNILKDLVGCPKYHLLGKDLQSWRRIR